jgi:hypothetical protein
MYIRGRPPLTSYLKRQSYVYIVTVKDEYIYREISLQFSFEKKLVNMFTSSTSPSYTSQCSEVSMESNESGFSSSLTNIVYYGPIQVRLYRRPSPTIATGRRPKHLILTGDEAVRREKRREKNREAARKLKDKRGIIEEELNQKIKELENEHSDLQSHLQQLHQYKQDLEHVINNLLIDPIEELLSNQNQDMPLFFEQHSDDIDLFDETIANILNSDCYIYDSLSTTN